MIPKAEQGGLQRVSATTHAFVQPPGGWCLNNAGVVAGAEATLLVDTAATYSRASHLRDAMRANDIRLPRYVVNTHFHGDHCFGNSLFTPEAIVISTTTTRDLIEASGLDLCSLWPAVEWGPIELETPQVTFEGELRVDLGDTVVSLIEVGPAHTPSDVVVWQPEDEVLFAGDIVWNGVTPFVLMGSVQGSLETLRQIEQLSPKTVVPGHGAVAGPEIIASTRKYLEWCLAIAHDAYARGDTPMVAAQRARKNREVPEMLDSERLVANLHRAFSELDGDPLGTVIDIKGPFEDLVRFNGEPPHCLA